MDKKSTVKFFVYGTLRPDIKVDWTDSVHKNPLFEVKPTKAYMPYSKLYLVTDIYNHVNKYPSISIEKDKYSKEDIVIGYILECTNPDEVFKVFDGIEDYPEFYDRKEEKCFEQGSNQANDAVVYFCKDLSGCKLLKVRDYRDYLDSTDKDSLLI